VICLNGDGSMLMSLGTLATVAESGARNLFLFVVQNDSYEVTGNQRIPGAGRLDWASIARGAGIERAFAFEDPADFAARVGEVIRGPGPVFAAVRVQPGAERPLARGAKAAEDYLRPSLAESARRLREALRQPEQTPRKMI
jgi:thiamine pyrophosphate-dependent acetolactate synthase large subunit-like protein